MVRYEGSGRHLRQNQYQPKLEPPRPPAVPGSVNRSSSMSCATTHRRLPAKSSGDEETHRDASSKRDRLAIPIRFYWSSGDGVDSLCWAASRRVRLSFRKYLGIICDTRDKPGPGSARD